MDSEIYDADQIPNQFINYIKKYSMDADELKAIQKRYPFAEDPMTIIIEMANNYPDQKDVTFSYEWMEFCDPILAKTLEQIPDIFMREATSAIRALDLPVEVYGELKDIRVQIDKFPYTTPIRAIRAKHSNTFIVIEGIVRAVGKKETTYSELACRCKWCETVTYEVQGDDGKEAMPLNCSTQSCTSKPLFSIVPELSTQRDFQTIEVEESLAGLNGQHPETIIVQFYDNLVGTVHAGDPVIITGVVKDARKTTQQGKSNRYISIIKANHVQTDGEMSYEVMEPEEMEEIMQLSSCPDLEDKFIGSLAPHIHGHKQIKRALILQLFSGTSYVAESGNHVRGDIHILWMSDPGLAKSETCDAITNIAPRSSFVSGKGASGVGLTASVSKDPINDDQYTLTAGALPMASGGIAILDEFDKMSEADTSTLHGAMEQQFIKIDKAGIHAKLRTECGILACANPLYGRFVDEIPLIEQVDIKPALLSRFELVYLSRDIPDQIKDKKISRHMLQSRRVGGLVSAGVEVSESDKGLVTPSIPQETFTRYIAYAKANIHPVLSEEALDIIENFFLSIRGAHDVTNNVHISYRYLYGLARLAEASAKMHLRSEATADDARVAVEIMADALKIFVDKTTGLPMGDLVEIDARMA